MFLDRCWYLEVKMKLFHIFLQGNFYQDTPLNCKIYFSSYWFLIQIGTRKVREQCEDLIGLGSLSEWVIGVMTFALNSDTVLLHDVSYFTCLFGTCCALYISILQAVERPDEHQPLTTDSVCWPAELHWQRDQGGACCSGLFCGIYSLQIHPWCKLYYLSRCRFCRIASSSQTFPRNAKQSCQFIQFLVFVK